MRTPHAVEFGAAAAPNNATIFLAKGPDEAGGAEVDMSRLAPVGEGQQFLMKAIQVFASAAPGGVLTDSYRARVNGANVGIAATMGPAATTARAAIGRLVGRGDRISVSITTTGVSAAVDISCRVEGEIVS